MGLVDWLLTFAVTARPSMAVLLVKTIGSVALGAAAVHVRTSPSERKNFIVTSYKRERR